MVTSSVPSSEHLHVLAMAPNSLPCADGAVKNLLTHSLSWRSCIRCRRSTTLKQSLLAYHTLVLRVTEDAFFFKTPAPSH